MADLLQVLACKGSGTGMEVCPLDQVESPQCDTLSVYSGLGAYFSKGNNTTEDYFLGSRGLPGWAVGFSLLSTTMSSVTFLAYPATSYILDWRYTISKSLWTC